jgi:hypothetical protein
VPDERMYMCYPVGEGNHGRRRHGPAWRDHRSSLARDRATLTRIVIAPVALDYENVLPRIPIPVQKMLLRLLAFLGWLLGYEASYPEYGDDRKDARMKQKQVLLTKKGWAGGARGRGE